MKFSVLHCVVLLCFRHHPGAWPVQSQISPGALWLLESSRCYIHCVLFCCASGIILVYDLSSHKSHQVLFDCWRVHGATYTVCCSVVFQASSWCMTCPVINLTRCSLTVGEFTVLHTLCVVLLCFRHHPGAWPVQSQVSPEPAEVAGRGAEQGHRSQKQWVGRHVIWSYLWLCLWTGMAWSWSCNNVGSL